MHDISLTVTNKSKRWKASSKERGTKQTGTLKEEVFLKVFPADIEAYKKMNVSENNKKRKATMVNVVLSFNISPFQTVIIFIMLFHQLILSEMRFKAEGKFCTRF